MNIPNILTVIRFLLIPILGYFLIEQHYYIAAVLFLTAGLTDMLDGYIARKFNMITQWGKVADPIADKLMQITALAILTLQGNITFIILIIVMAKEAFMIAGGIFLYKKNDYVVSAKWYGKAAAAIFNLAILLAIFNLPFSKFIVGFAVLFTLFAFFMYLLDFRKIRIKYNKITYTKKPEIYKNR